MNFDPSIISAFPAPVKIGPPSSTSPELLDPSILTVVPSGKAFPNGNKFVDPCIVLAQPTGLKESVQPAQQFVRPLASGQGGFGIDHRSVPTFSGLGPVAVPSAVEIAQQQLQQQQQLVKMIQQQSQLEVVQQLQLQQLLQQTQPQIAALQLQQQAQQLTAQLQLQQRFPLGQPISSQPVTQQHVVPYNAQQVAQLQIQELQQLQQQLQQQGQQPASFPDLPTTSSAQNGFILEPGVFAIPQAPVSDRTSPFTGLGPSFGQPQGTIFGPLQPAPKSQQERQSRNRRAADPARQQDHQRLQRYVDQESSYEHPPEKPNPLPVRRPTKALEIVDPKTNAVVETGPAITKADTDRAPGAAHDSPSRLSSVSKAVPIVDPKTNTPIPESASPSPTVNSPYAPPAADHTK